MKKLTLLSILFFIATNFMACKKKGDLQTKQIIRKYHLTPFYRWDPEYTPFRKNASLYANKKTDSCLLILRNKKGDTILSHLDKSIVNMTLLEYKASHGNWLVIKKDFGKTTFDNYWGGISNTNKERFPFFDYYIIDKETKALRKINLISKKEFYNKIATKFKHLKNVSLVGLENNSVYVFKDTLKNQQLLYQLTTEFHLQHRNGKYVLNAEFKDCHLVQTFTNGINCQSSSDVTHIGEKIFYGKNNWEYNFRYELRSKKYYTFKSHIKRYDNLPGFDLVKTEIILYDNQNKTTKIIKDFPKDSLFENEYFAITRQKRKGKLYLGVTGQDHSVDFYYELDTVRWKLIKLPAPFNNLGIY